MSKKINNPKLVEKLDRIKRAREVDRARTHAIDNLMLHCKQVVDQDDFYREAFTDQQIGLLKRLRNNIDELIGTDAIEATDPDMKT